MRALILVVALLAAGCVSEQTRRLAQGVHLYQAKMAEEVVKLADAARGKGDLAGEDHRRIIEGQRALTESTKSLHEILGEPRTPVEVDSW